MYDFKPTQSWHRAYREDSLYLWGLIAFLWVWLCLDFLTKI